MNEPPSWLDELDLDPGASPVSMGVRALGDRPWLVADGDQAAQLRLKATLCRDRHHEVFAVEEGADVASAAVAELVAATGVDLVTTPDLHPLDRAGRSVQEDLCILERRPGGWYLTAASLCFPSRWRLHDKMGRHITEVHGPVEGYQDRLAARVDTFLDRLTTSPVWRRNWFVHPDAQLFQPDRPAGGDPIIAAADALDDLVVRSERQTLRRLDMAEDAIVFTIRIQQASVRELVADPERCERFRHLLVSAPAATLTHRGMRPAQVVELQEATRTLATG